MTWSYSGARHWKDGSLFNATEHLLASKPIFDIKKKEEEEEEVTDTSVALFDLYTFHVVNLISLDPYIYL